MSTSRLLLYFRKPAVKDRFILGDRYILPLLRKIIKGQRQSSLEMVFQILCKGFDLLNQPYQVNVPFHKIHPNDKIIILGLGEGALKGYEKPNKLVAGIGLMTHPSMWLDLFQTYPVTVYLQHSEWTCAIYNKWFGSGTCKIWPAGINTQFWQPKSEATKAYILVYVKFLWNQEQNKEDILKPILNYLKKENIPYKTIVYGDYDINTYKELLISCKGMIFLCEHESQGLAYQEAMAMNVPIFAWDQGFWLDPNRFEWGEKNPVPSSSVPYFDERCGDKFKNLDEFYQKFPTYYHALNAFKFTPRDYVLENLSLEKSAEKMLAIVDEAYSA